MCAEKELHFVFLVIDDGCLGKPSMLCVRSQAHFLFPPWKGLLPPMTMAAVKPDLLSLFHPTHFPKLPHINFRPSSTHFISGGKREEQLPIYKCTKAPQTPKKWVKWTGVRKCGKVDCGPRKKLLFFWGEMVAFPSPPSSRHKLCVMSRGKETGGGLWSYLGTQGVRVMNPPPSLRIPL